MMGKIRNEEIMDDKPLVTFALFAYNQEQFIREAIEGAFAQTYSPLEIILSDDCSSDNTFKIMKDMAAAYSGPHTVRVRACAKNRGLAEHINAVMAEVRSEFIVVAAGDDVSLPYRVTSAVNAWQMAGCPVCVLYSDVMETYENGMPWKRSLNNPITRSYISEFSKNIPHPVIGASECIHRDLFYYFGPLASDIVNEDSAIWFRAELRGQIIYVPEILVNHRWHSNNLTNNLFADDFSGDRWLQGSGKTFGRRRALISGLLADITVHIEKGGIRNDFEEIRCRLTRRLRFVQAAEYICNDRRITRFKHVFSYLWYTQNGQDFILLSKLFFPKSYRGLRRWIRKLKFTIRKHQVDASLDR